jgi:hypothetical protein
VTRGKAGNYWRRKSTDPFDPVAIVLTTGTSYAVPSGATSMKAWAVGGGSNRTSAFPECGGAGGVAVKTWTVSGDDVVTYAVAPATANGGSPSATTVTFSGTTITGNSGSGQSGGSASGGDVNTSGGGGDFLSQPSGFEPFGGAVGGNSASRAACNRTPATTVSGLLAAVELAGLSITESCGTSAAFGSGGALSGGTIYAAGIGGGGAVNSNAGSGAVVLYFT